MLASEPMYLTQLSGTLKLGQQAIFRHLQFLEDVGLLESDFKESGQGAPRKYYQIARQVRVEVQIAPEMFDVELFDVPRIEIQIPEDNPELAAIVKECNRLAQEPNSKSKISAYSKLLKRLSKELESISIAKSIAEATYSKIRRQIRTTSYELLPQRIDQRIIQTLASRGGKLAIDVLALVLNITEELLKQRLAVLEKSGLLLFKDEIVSLL
jgi:predicted transcriptional regulator